MALIKCSNCGSEISDKALKCPKCGVTIVEDNSEQIEKACVKCEECGTEIMEGEEACSNCGCPVPVADMSAEQNSPQKVEVTAVNLSPMKKNTKRNIIIAVVAILLIVVLFFAGSSMQKQNRADAYAETLETAAYTMLLGAAEAEEAGGLIRNVWYNAIYEEYDSETNKYTRPNGYYVSDFNEALANLFSDSTFMSTISSIKSNQETVASMMKDLQNPPEGFEEAYDAMKDFNRAYTSLTNLAIDPTGSLTSFTQDFNDADSDAVNCYNALELYLDN